MKKITLGFCVVLSTFAFNVKAQSDFLDPAFGNAGKVITAIGATGGEYANCIALQEDGKILAGGTSKGATANVFTIARYSKDGVLDASFGTGGIVTTAIGTLYDGASGLAVQKDGKIIASGFTYNSTLDYAVVRYNSDGTLDTSFGTNGKTVVNLVTGSQDVVRSMVIQNDGKIVLAGYVQIGSSARSFGVVRLTTEGVLDVTFGTAGIFTYTFDTVASTVSDAYGIALQNDGKLVVVGKYYNTSVGTFGGVIRLTESGSLDASFGTAGTVVIKMGDNINLTGIAIQSDQKIVAIGDVSNPGTSHDFAVVRLNTDGSLDSNFGTGGKVSTNFAVENDVPAAVVIQPNGKIVVGGSAYPGTTLLDFAIARYLSDGSLDTSFGTGGKLISEMGTGGNVISAMALQTDGKLVVAGQVNAGTSSDFALARYIADASMGIDDFALESASLKVAPNPISASTVLQYTLNRNDVVTIGIYDIEGKLVQNIMEKTATQKGNYELAINFPENTATGTYFIVISTPNGKSSLKVIK